MGEAAAVQSAFIDRLERDGFGNPFVIARAPGRVNLIGDHVDYCGGLVMPIAIEASCLCAVIPGRAGSGRVAISSELTGETIAVEIGKPLVPGQDAPIGAWPSYIIGVLAGLQGVGSLEALDGCELRVTSAVPLGAGLSSSAALEVSVATAAAQVAGIMLDEKQRARLCQRAEHEFAGVPCGLMDQMVSSAAQRGNALLLDCQSEEIQHVPFPAAPRLLVVNSGVSHSLADGQYAARRASCQAAADKLGIEHLAHAAMADVEKLDAELIPYARHVVSETARVSAAAEAFSSDQLRHAGELMSASHASLRDDFRVSCDEVDVLVARLIESDAVLGARMTGGGFGGSVVALVTDGGEDEAISCADSCRDTCPDLAHFFASPCGGAELVYDQQA